NEGQLYRVDPAAEEITILADLEPRQVPALLNVGEDRFLLGTANPAQIVRLAPTYAPQAVVTSQALDAGQISLWGKLQIMAHAPGGTGLEVQTRSGNVADPDATEGSWSKWSKPHKVGLVGGHSAYIEVESPNARFLQYRLRLRSEGEATPSVLSVSLKYLMPNLKPKIESIQSAYAKAKPRGDEKAPTPLNVLKIEWKASDPNKDRLRYRLEVKPYGTDDPFVTIKDNLAENNFSWNTLTTPDGRYLLRVAASDEGDNIPEQALVTSRRSDPVIIDNTPPEVRDLVARQTGPGSAQLSAHLADDLTAVSEIRYNVDSDKDWKFVLPRDLIYDSTSESVQVKIDGLSTGAHVLTLRASDSQGNTRYVSRRLDIKP
ncbi:MAG: hypothetical protein OER86_04230, partial [Phycisphaerae bacterium]|nr:hypothetical protein [Phycisphaerae bacterium]